MSVNDIAEGVPGKLPRADPAVRGVVAGAKLATAAVRARAAATRG